MAEEDEATSKKVVLKKEYGSAKNIKPGMKIKRPAGRKPMSKARASTQVPEKPEELAAEGKKRKERVKKTMARVVGQPSMMEEGEDVAELAPKAPKLTGDAIRSGAATSKPKEAPKAAPKAKSAPKRNTRNIPAA